MTIWLDNHLSPGFARWITERTGRRCVVVSEVGLSSATDAAIYTAARDQADIFVTKDRDFLGLAKRRGPPPAIIRLAIGNTSTRHLVECLADKLPDALKRVAMGESIVELKVDD